MIFGRQKNLTRRASRPDEGFHRNRRRRGVDRLAMLETGRRRKSFGARLAAALTGLFRRRQ